LPLKRPKHLTLGGQLDEYGVEKLAADSSKYPVYNQRDTSCDGEFGILSVLYGNNGE